MAVLQPPTRRRSSSRGCRGRITPSPSAPPSLLSPSLTPFASTPPAAAVLSLVATETAPRPLLPMLLLLLCSLVLSFAADSSSGSSGLAFAVEAATTTTASAMEEDEAAAAAAMAPLSTAELVAAATPTAAAQQAALRKLIAAASRMVSFTLTTDIALTSPFPTLPNKGGGISITGNCKDRNGRPRRCVIDGAGRHGVFTGYFDCRIELRSVVVQNVFGSVHKGGCGFRARDVVFRNNVAARGAVLDSRDENPNYDEVYLFYRCVFVNNSALFGPGGAFAVGSSSSPSVGPTLSLTDCTFTNNLALNAGGGGGGRGGAGGAIDIITNHLVLTRVVFRGNAAVTGGAIRSTSESLTAINTTFEANTATAGGGGAVVLASEVEGLGGALFCACTFRGNSAKKTPSRFPASSGNVLVSVAAGGSVQFCSGVIPGGIAKPKLVSIVRGCKGCTGCQGDCNGKGTCMPDPLYSSPTCRCANHYDSATSCRTCKLGYTPRSQCRQCELAFYRPAGRPSSCALCPGIDKVPFDQGLESLIGSVRNVQSAAGPLQCQKLCTATQRGPDGQLASLYCNMWIYLAPRAGVPLSCAGKCVTLSVNAGCGIQPVRRLPSLAISYQNMEPDLGLCNEDEDEDEDMV